MKKKMYYFKHYCDLSDSDAMQDLEDECGFEGVAVFYKLIEKQLLTEYHKFPVDKKERLMRNIRFTGGINSFKTILKVMENSGILTEKHGFFYNETYKKEFDLNSKTKKNESERNSKAGIVSAEKRRAAKAYKEKTIQHSVEQGVEQGVEHSVEQGVGKSIQHSVNDIKKKEEIDNNKDKKTQDKKDGVGFPFLQILMDGYPKPFNKFDDEVLRAIQQALSVEPDTAVIVSGMAEYKTHLTAIDLPMQKITRVGKWLNEGHWKLNYQDETRRILAEKSSRLPAKPSNVLDLDKMDYSGEF